MSVTEWIISQHLFFRELSQHLLNVLRRHHRLSLDELVVRSRRPVRTILLALENLLTSGQVHVVEGDLQVYKHAHLPFYPSSYDVEYLNGAISQRYLQLATEREKPALLWGQRRLLPTSAVNRAYYILNQMRKTEGVITFLGDDDLVSPLVSAFAPHWDVHVVDIDAEILSRASSIAAQLDTQVQLHHSDLASAAADSPLKSDIAVGDPFPSGDGSFEEVFWGVAARILQPQGTLVTTIAPSHKPLSYSLGALKKLQNLGFCLKDLRENFGEYEVFDFEFLPYEKRILDTWALESHVSHTKSLLSAHYVPESNQTGEGQSPSFAYQHWMWSAAAHYLTLQAGQDDQIQIANSRGVASIKEQDSKNVREAEGLSISVMIPQPLREKLRSLSGSPSDLVADCVRVLEEHFHVRPTDAEIAELIRISNSASLTTDGQLAQLGLSIRAIESWERWRLDN